MNHTVNPKVKEHREPPKCEICQKVFTEYKNLYKHIRIVHKINPYTPCATITCPHGNCAHICKNYNILREHMEEEHHFEMEVLQKTFKSKIEFNEWKATEEQNEICSFTFRSSYIAREGKKTYFVCNRSGESVSQSKNIRASKKQGSCRSGLHCPAGLEIIDKEGCIEMIYFKTHFGHEKEICHLRQNAAFKAEIVDFKPQGQTEPECELSEDESFLVVMTATQKLTAENSIMKLNSLIELFQTVAIENELSIAFNKEMDKMIDAFENAKNENSGKTLSTEEPASKTMLPQQKFNLLKKRQVQQSTAISVNSVNKKARILKIKW